MPKVTKKAPKKASPLLDEEEKTTKDSNVEEATDTGSEADNAEDTAEEDTETKAAPAPKKAEAPKSGSAKENVAQALKSDIEVTRIALSKEPTVNLMIPLNGEKKGAFEDVWINGYHMRVPKGVMSIVPQSVAELINNKYDIESTVGEEFRLDLNADKHDAVS